MPPGGSRPRPRCGVTSCSVCTLRYGCTRLIMSESHGGRERYIPANLAMARWDTGLDLNTFYTKNAGWHRRPLKPRSGRFIGLRHLTISPSGQPDVFSLIISFSSLSDPSGPPLPWRHSGEVFFRHQGDEVSFRHRSGKPRARREAISRDHQSRTRG